ncbi:hypothetical protein [Mycolicibacterium fluoranthenivorans]|uniref:Uncharacterized protein n=1 Tax=Mycolicibacterium fluoranthenivorans TaxID=258505 RepID=A0A7X5ZFM7_9MYCO|nr:hypothetical protein [Mycolicibacterium fluoranthenivorans]MCV7355394.1 hypothetical protein [Mycolicibacterium fluoranthenivorans]NIH98335.1 hypothetical protein [Mycolicibacterium fluoranthenivorans]
MADGTWDPELVGSSAFHKLEHGFEIRDRLRDVLAEQQAVERQYSRRDNRTDHASRRTWAEWALESDLDYTESALLMGDFVHNLRAALDHAVWAITPQHIRQERPTEVAFPLRSTEKSSTTWAKKRRDWYGPTVFEVIRSNQPFNAAGTGTLHPLHILQFLSNTDKHQLLNIVANSQVDMGGVSVDPEPPGGVVSSVNQGVVAKGSVLARVEFSRPENPGTTTITLMPVFAFEQVFRYVDLDATENWLVVGDALNEIGPDVVEAVGHVLSAHAHDTISST